MLWKMRIGATWLRMPKKTIASRMSSVPTVRVPNSSAARVLTRRDSDRESPQLAPRLQPGRAASHRRATTPALRRRHRRPESEIRCRPPRAHSAPVLPRSDCQTCARRRVQGGPSCLRHTNTRRSRPANRCCKTTDKSPSQNKFKQEKREKREKNKPGQELAQRSRSRICRASPTPHSVRRVLYGDPLPGSRRALHGVEHVLHRKAIAEVRMKIFMPGEAMQEFRDRRNERVLVADDVARTPEIAEDGMLHVGDEEIAKALLSRQLGGIEKLQMIQALEVEAQPPFLRVYLESVAILAADAEPCGLERTDAAVGELHHRHDRIVHRAAVRERARRRHHAVDRSVEIESGVEQVGEQIVADA